ncbi:MAG: serine/threonine protein kinase [Proteobacteria bacterium]|nr:serine/threonine protein kinase [Pseudomonadota bacterium]
MFPGSDHAGTIVDGRWRLGPEIGRGRAALHRATDLATGEMVALKLPLPGADRALWRAAAETEAAVLGACAHPGIVRLRGVGTLDGLPVLALQYLPGPDLRGACRTGEALAPERAARLLRSTADALAWLHGRGSVHGDVKPANLVCGTDGMPLLVDFATARPAGSVLPAGAARIVTTAYAAPGQLRGAAADPRDDVYALAVVAYELIAGRHPFARRGVQPGEIPPPPAAIAARGWEALRACLAWDASERPADARAVPEALGLGRVLSLPRWPLPTRRRARCPA